jgi:P-type Ca2+ transporter type 2C
MQIKGLTTTEAKLLQQQFGLNKISETHSFHYLNRILSQVFSLLNLLLIAAAVVSFIIGETADAAIILAIVIINGGISFWQEFKAEQTLAELRKLTPTFSRVVRDGKEVLLDTDQIVPGDLILLEVGDKIPVDGVIIESINFEANESMLTGESIPVYKKPDEPEHNQLFAGTIAAAGRARLLAQKTGDNTRFGKIAKSLALVEETATPLQKQIKKLAVNLAILSVVASAAIYFIGVSLKFNNYEMFLTAVSSAVAMVPEGLPSILLITMAVGVKRMAMRRAIVRKLVAIEALGSVNVICTDKTGTLTQGNMQVQKIWMNNKLLGVTEFQKLIQHPNAHKFVDAMLVANTASLAYKFDHGGAEVLGDTTEGALLLFARRIGIDYDVYRGQGQLVDEFSFDQKLKAMSVVWRVQNKAFGLTKGSPEFMVANSKSIAIGDKIHELKPEQKQELVHTYQELAKQGYRVLGFAYKDEMAQKNKYDRAEVESDMVFVGFAALQDPLRPEVKHAIRTATKAGVRSVMITGDNELTAMNIARELGLAVEGDEVMLGKDLEKISENELRAVIEKVKVFARTNPEDKLRIVKAFQTAGFSVAVTGDGVNDSLALKQAEVGVAMGKKGTDVAKEAADIVITDDNYATIISAIEEGRTIYDNIIKSVRYLLSTNIGEVLLILIALIFGLPAPLLPIQILWTNLVSDGLPALALAVDPKDPHAMSRRPRLKQEKLLTASVFGQLFAIGLVVALIVLFIYWYIYRTTNDLTLARTWAFTSLIILQMIVAFIIHGVRSKNNFNLIGAVLLTLLIQFLIISTPGLYGIFEITRPW